MFSEMILLSLLGGSGVFIGALLAGHEVFRNKCFQNEFNHFMTALGGGALLYATTSVFIPEGVGRQSLTSTILTYLSGGAVFMALDRFLAKRKTRASQLVALLLDFIPEAMMIGAIVTINFKQALLLAIIIFVQNVPESFSAYHEMNNISKIKKKHFWVLFLLISLTGPIYVFIGKLLFFQHDQWLAMLMTFCAGGILYIVFNDIAPKAKLRNHWLPAMGALMGFCAGLIGHAFLN